MKNFEKYKSPEEAIKHLSAHCLSAECENCKYYSVSFWGANCPILWLYDEAEEKGD